MAPGTAAPADNAQFLRKQRAAIEVLAADNLKLKEELMLENKFSVNPTSATAAALIANLQEQADVYATKARCALGVVVARCCGRQQPMEHHSAGLGCRRCQRTACPPASRRPPTLAPADLRTCTPFTNPPMHRCRQITEEQRLRAELEAQVEALRRHIADQRVAMGGIHASGDQAVKVGGLAQGLLSTQGIVGGLGGPGSRLNEQAALLSTRHPGRTPAPAHPGAHPAAPSSASRRLPSPPDNSLTPTCRPAPAPHRPATRRSSAASARWRTGCSRPACGTTSSWGATAACARASTACAASACCLRCGGGAVGSVGCCLAVSMLCLLWCCMRAAA